MRNPEAIKRANKNWVLRNPDKVKAIQRRYHSKPEYKIKKNANRRAKYNEEGSKIRAEQRERRTKLRDIVIAHYGGKCMCCGESSKGFLTADHINGEAPEIAVVGRKLGNWQLYAYLIKYNFPPGYQLLCANCNLGISWWGVCPHKQEPY